MKNYVLIFCLFFTIGSHAQKEKKTNIKLAGGVFSSSAMFSTMLSDSWSLQNGIGVSYNYDAKRAQVPFYLSYKVNKKLSVFAGPQLYYTSNIDHYDSTPQSSLFGVSAELGVQYDFSEDAFLRVSHEYNFTAKKYNDLGLSGEKSLINFKVGYKF